MKELGINQDQQQKMSDSEVITIGLVAQGTYHRPVDFFKIMVLC